MQESIIEEEQEEEYGYNKWFTYTAISIAVIVSLISWVASYIYSSNAKHAIEEANKAKQQTQQALSSTGAQIDKLLNVIYQNKKEWEKLEKQQDVLNNSTDKAQNELTKYHVSVIN